MSKLVGRSQRPVLGHLVDFSTPPFWSTTIDRSMLPGWAGQIHPKFLLNKSGFTTPREHDIPVDVAVKINS